MTRWWLVGACACSFLESFSTWERICNGIRKAAPSDSGAYKVASATFTLMQEPMIVSDIFLLATIHEFFLFPHFKWCQQGDPEVGNTPSFQSRHMLVRYFLMHSQIANALKNDEWLKMEKFGNFVSTFGKLNEEEISIQKLKVRHFLDIILKSLTKHFSVWISSNLLFLSLFEESNTATCVANFFWDNNVASRKKHV